MRQRKSFSRAVLVRGSLVVAWMGVIFAFSALPGSPYPYVDPPLWYFLERKGAHVVEYAILMLLSVRFFYALFPGGKFRDILILAGVLSLAYGVTDELHQFFVPYRGAKVTDVLIDALGIALAAFFLWVARPLPKPKKSPKRQKT